MSAGLSDKSTCPATDQLRKEFEHLTSSWWCFLLMGIFLMVCGTVALAFPIVTNVAAMMVLGVVLMVSGVVTIVTAFWTGKWSGLLLQLLVGILYLVVGMQIADTPVKAGVVMAVFIAGFFIVAGAFRAVAALVLRFPHWGGTLLNGIVTLLCGVVIYRHFPECALWVVGLLVGLEMLFNGWTWIMLAMAVRSLRRPAA